MASETKFTPGPWFINRSEMGIHKYVEARIGGGMIQEVACCGPTELHEQSDANARLIAAAPDLYAVVEELEESSSYWSEYCVPLGIVDRLREALAKARGEA